MWFFKTQEEIKTSHEFPVAFALNNGMFESVVSADDGGFIAGQVFKSSGFISENGSLNGAHDGHGCLGDELSGKHIAIVTYWRSFDQHEQSHTDTLFREKFNNLKNMCDDTFEIGYDLLWQGEPE
jgi:hypothetical protein